MRKPYTHPPTPVYNLGKKKQRTTVAINALKGLLADELEDHPVIQAAVNVLIGYRKSLDEI